MRYFMSNVTACNWPIWQRGLGIWSHIRQKQKQKSDSITVHMLVCTAHLLTVNFLKRTQTYKEIKK